MTPGAAMAGVGLSEMIVVEIVIAVRRVVRSVGLVAPAVQVALVAHRCGMEIVVALVLVLAVLLAHVVMEIAHAVMVHAVVPAVMEIVVVGDLMDRMTAPSCLQASR